MERMAGDQLAGRSKELGREVGSALEDVGRVQEGAAKEYKLTASQLAELESLVS